MAIKPYVFEERNDGAVVHWPEIGNGDTGEPFDLGGYNDNTVAVQGTFNSQTLTMQGSISVKGEAGEFTSLHKPNGDVLSFTEDGKNILAEAPDMIRPSCGGASGTSLSVRVRLRKS